MNEESDDSAEWPAREVVNHHLVAHFLRPFKCGNALCPVFSWNDEHRRAIGATERPDSLAVLNDWYKAPTLPDGTEDRRTSAENKAYVQASFKRDPGKDPKTGDPTLSNLFHGTWSEDPIRNGSMRVMNMLCGERTQNCKSSTSEIPAEVYQVALVIWLLPIAKLINPKQALYLCGGWSWYVREKVRDAFPHLKVLCQQHPSSRRNGWKERRLLKGY
jgi:hypothetical protein